MAQNTHTLLENFAVLTLLAMSVFLIGRGHSRLGTIPSNVLHGLAFGSVAFLVTATPLALPDGATVDARAGPVIVAGIIGGPIATVIAAALGAVARGIVGGTFISSGMLVYGFYAAIGTAAWAWAASPRAISKPLLVGVLILGSWLAALAMFFFIQPTEVAVQWLRHDVPLILLANTVSIGYTAFAVGVGLVALRKDQQLIALNETLNHAKLASNFGIWDLDVKTGELTWDERSAELHGTTVKEFGRDFHDWARLVHPEDLAASERRFRDFLDHGSTFQAEYRVTRADGEEGIVRGDAIVIRDKAGLPQRVVGTNIDLTQLRRTEAELVMARAVAEKAQKFEAIGHLSGGIAHDFNNLLAVIMGNQELLRDMVDQGGTDPDEMRELIGNSIDAAQRGAELTRNLLAYARRARLHPEVTDLNQIVRETESWLRRTIESRVDIETVLQAGLWKTSVDRASMQSALINLLVNARDALDGPGKVTIETSNIRIDADYVSDRHADIPPGRYVMLAVTDTGPGIAADIRDQIFDPFFSTKDVGQGSGLGLSMVQGFVTQSGGMIRVYSEVGVGTSFKAYLPALADSGESSQPGQATSAPTTAPAKPATARVLVVEDQPELLEILVKTLANAGYSVVPAPSGDAAFIQFQNDPEIDVVVTDIVMPGDLQGPILAKAIRKIRPDTPFVFISGYANEAMVHGNGLLPEDVRLMKPISRATLLDAVASALASGPGGPAD